MKKKFFLFIGIFALILTSCNLDPENYQTPNIGIIAIKNHTDTLKFEKYDYDLSASVMDTVSVSDTVSFRLYLIGYYNIIKEFHLTPSSDNKSEIILQTDSLDKYCLPQSDYEKGIFYFKEGYIGLPFNFQYVPDKVSNDARLTFKVITDAKSQYSQNSVTIKTPFSKAKIDDEDEIVPENE